MPTLTTIRMLSEHVGQTVTLQGWLHGSRSSGKLMFLQLRDGTGLCQALVEAATPDVFAAARELTQESSLRATGLIRGDARAPGGFEMVVTHIELIQKAADYPITRKAHGTDFLMNHRHLWLRSRRQTAILRVRHTLIRAIRDFFDSRGFTLIDTPLLIQSAAEGAGTLFPVDFFGEKAYLAQTGQLYLESACMALGKVYCFGPTFRAEKSKTRRHLTEFWMVEPEVAFAVLDDLAALAEDFLCSIVDTVLARHTEEFAVVERDTTPLRNIAKPFPRLTYSAAVDILRSAETAAQLDKELTGERRRLQEKIAALDGLIAEKTKAAKAWQQDKLDGQLLTLREEIRELELDVAAAPAHIEQARTFPWGKDLGGSDETILSRRFDKPLIVTGYPREVKAFYMKADPTDPRVVLNMDVLAPEGYGEIIGGSQREDDLSVLEARMRAEGMNPADYGWYLDLRRYGSVPHGGFGLGVERTLAWICGLPHVRETIPFPRLMGRMVP
ncbi:MAG: asparagine--tRNA ligase [Lentisphaerae bacterium]|nr:asparagine--tRNA ligase [Lentisphaerota bacterium]